MQDYTNEEEAKPALENQGNKKKKRSFVLLDEAAISNVIKLATGQKDFISHNFE